MKRITLEQKMRAQGVTRWHIVRTSVKQSLADHLFGTAMIADTILLLFAEFYRVDASSFYRHYRSKIIDKALHHDILEVLTGDTPSPYKQWHARMFACKPAEPTHLAMFETAEAVAAHSPTDDLLDAMVKLADAIEAYHFVSRYAIDAHGQLVAQRLDKRLDAAQDWMPTIDADEELVKAARMDTGVNRFKTPRGGPITPVGTVDWAGFVYIIIESLQHRPEEINDDESLAGGGLPTFARKGGRRHGRQDGPDRESGPSGERGHSVLPSGDGGNRNEGNQGVEGALQDPAETPAVD